jgi:hypothetical protein
MFSMLLVYLFLTIPKLSVFFGVGAAIFGFASAGAIIYRTLGCTDCYGRTLHDRIPGANKTMKWVIPLFVVCGLFTTLVPSKETSYAMAAAYVAQEAVQSELGQSAIALLQANVNEALAELKKPETKK